MVFARLKMAGRRGIQYSHFSGGSSDGRKASRKGNYWKILEGMGFESCKQVFKERKWMIQSIQLLIFLLRITSSFPWMITYIASLLWSLVGTSPAIIGILTPPSVICQSVASWIALTCFMSLLWGLFEIFPLTLNLSLTAYYREPLFLPTFRQRQPLPSPVENRSTLPSLAENRSTLPSSAENRSTLPSLAENRYPFSPTPGEGREPDTMLMYFTQKPPEMMGRDLKKIRRSLLLGNLVNPSQFPHLISHSLSHNLSQTPNAPSLMKYSTKNRPKTDFQVLFRPDRPGRSYIVLYDQFKKCDLIIQTIHKAEKPLQSLPSFGREPLFLPTFRQRKPLPSPAENRSTLPSPVENRSTLPSSAENRSTLPSPAQNRYPFSPTPGEGREPDTMLTYFTRKPLEMMGRDLKKMRRSSLLGNLVNPSQFPHLISHSLSHNLSQTPNGPSLMKYSTKASLVPESSFIAKPAASWLDDFLVWLSPKAFGCCRKFVNGRYYPPNDQCPCCQPNEDSCGISEACKDCTTCFHQSDLYEGRPSTAQFKEKLPWFLKASPSANCAKGGSGTYSSSIDFTGFDSGMIQTSSFRHIINLSVDKWTM
ncbi:hypothetical protein M5K25_006914 [Dendrobium thyrsiflorum]|uniref:Uncharacterized protein n=1 Tax=Dendrobium thyrsiflorum TaxID=117978 RepID=A0ABD0VD00_DENTH